MILIPLEEFRVNVLPVHYSRYLRGMLYRKYDDGWVVEVDGEAYANCAFEYDMKENDPATYAICEGAYHTAKAFARMAFTPDEIDKMIQSFHEVFGAQGDAICLEDECDA